MEITTELIKHLANLSRLNFSDEEVENFKVDFGKTINEINKLQEIETGSEIEYDNIINARDLRKDEIGQSLSVDQVIFNAHNSKSGCVVVPKVVE